MGRGLIERAGLGPRASVSAAVARTGPQAGASWRANRPYQKTEAELPKAARGETEPTGRKLVDTLILSSRNQKRRGRACTLPRASRTRQRLSTHQQRTRRRGDFATHTRRKKARGEKKVPLCSIYLPRVRRTPREIKGRERLVGVEARPQRRDRLEHGLHLEGPRREIGSFGGG